jgi:hypothetical protein
MKTRYTKNFKRMRQANPGDFDKQSFRTKQINKKTKIIIGCPKGKYNPKNNKCKVSTQIQSILKVRKK